VSEESGLICAFELDGNGGGTEVGWDEVRAWTPERGLLWMHLDYTAADVGEWLASASGLDEITREALAAEHPRPRSVASGNGLLVIERVINLNEGAEPEDMVSVRMWLEAGRVITLRHRRVNALKQIRDRVIKGRGPNTIGEFLTDFTDLVLDRIGRVVSTIDDAADDLEDLVLSRSGRELRPKLADLRRQAIALRRYIAPQRDVLTQLQHEKVDFLDGVSRARVREEADRLTRYVEDLDAARDRATVTQEELSSRLQESVDRRLYVLAIISMVFLPLGFLTGVFGVNVGGIPGQTHEYGFWIMCGALSALALAQLWLFRVMRWL
jgi:zinc transporter